jgi:hypothetical protein
MYHFLILFMLASGFLTLGFLIGGTVAWYKGWDEGFREGYEVQTTEEMKCGSRSPAVYSRDIAHPTPR